MYQADKMSAFELLDSTRFVKVSEKYFGADIWLIREVTRLLR